MTLETTKAVPEFDPEIIEKKVELIEQGLPIDISEDELHALEDTLRGARSFYIDMLEAFEKQKASGENLEDQFVEESKNLAGVEMALRKIDDFRKTYWTHIKNAE